MSLPTPNTRKEQYLNAIATGNAGGLPTPITREEEYLEAIAKSGGGSGEGDMKKSVYDSDLAVSEAGGIKAFVNSAVAGKVDKVEGKGLSTNDYDNTEKGKVADNTAAIEAIVNEYGAKNLLPNNATSQTVADGTITVNSDGSIRTNIATTNGVAYDITDYFTVPTGDYIFSKGMSMRQSQIWLQFFNGATFVKDIKLEGEASKLVTIDYDGYTQIKCVGYIPSSTTIDTIIYPMIRDARITDPTYVPYAMTNEQLTDKSQFKLVQTIECNSTYLVGSLSLYANELTRQCFLAGNVQTAYDDIVNLWRPIASIDTNYIPKAVAFNAVAISNSGGAVVNRGYVSKNTANAVVAYTIDGTHSAGNTVDIYLTWIY